MRWRKTWGKRIRPLKGSVYSQVLKPVVDSFIYPWLPHLGNLVHYFPWHMKLSHTSVKISHQASSATTLSPPSFIYFIYLLQHTFSLGKCMTASMKFILPTLSFQSYILTSCNINYYSLASAFSSSLVVHHHTWIMLFEKKRSEWREEMKEMEREGKREDIWGFSNIYYIFVCLFIGMCLF